MPAPINPFKQALKGDAPLIGCWLGMASQYSAEIAATAGFDWLVVDGEHSPNDIRSIRDQLMVIDPSASNAVVRLPVGETWLIKQALDIGAQTLLIPIVESAAQARELVAATRYPPEGVRGLGSSLARASRFAAIPDYPQTANAEICLLVQVETRAGLDALEEIAAVEGVDGVFIGPADLGASLGYLGQTEHPDLWRVITDALSRIRARGKAAGVLTGNPDLIAAAIAAGANFVAVGADITVFATGLRALAQRYRNGA